MTVFKLALGAAVLALAGPTFAQNLLTNGDFSANGPGNPLAPTGWTITNNDGTAGVFNDAQSLPGGGNYFWLNDFPGQLPTILQSFSVVPGLSYDVSGNYGSRVNGGGTNTLLIEFLDTSNSTVLHSTSFNPTVGNAWASFNYATPVFNVSNVTMRLTSQVGGFDDDYKLDNLSVTTAAPEPGTLALLGLSVPLALRLRRRK
jgi:hypothetical protein